MKTFKEFMTEAGRGYGDHSFGMRTPIHDYAKGLDAADKRHAEDTKDIKKRYKDMRGSWGKEEHKHGITQEHGSGEYSGYHTSRYTTTGNKHNVSVHHEGTPIAKVTKNDKGYRVSPIHDNHVSPVGSHHSSRKAALHHAVAMHKDKLFNSY